MAEPLNATFFTLKQRDRAVLLPATLVFVVLMALLIAAFVAVNWGLFASFVHMFRLAQQGAEAPFDEAAGLQMFSQVMLLMLTTFLFLFPLYLLVAAYEAACLRWMIRGETPGLFGLTLNDDVWRVYGVYWCWFLAQFTVSFATSIIMMPVMFATMGQMMGGAGGPPDPAAMLHWQLTVQLPLSLLQYIPLAFIGVRFGPAAATSIARRRFSFFEAWAVTRDRFWALFGSYALLWLIVGVLMTAILATTYGFVFAGVWQEIFATWPEPAKTLPHDLLTRMFSPQGLTVIGLGYAAYAVIFLGYALMSYGVNARAALAALEDGKIAPYAETA